MKWLVSITPKKFLPFLRVVFPDVFKESPPPNFLLKEGRFESETVHLPLKSHRVPLISVSQLHYYLSQHNSFFQTYPTLVGVEASAYSHLKASLGAKSFVVFNIPEGKKEGLLVRRPEIHPSPPLELLSYSHLQDYLSHHKKYFGWKPLSVGLEEDSYNAVLFSHETQAFGSSKTLFPDSVVVLDVELYKIQQRPSQELYLIRTQQSVEI